MNIEDVLETLRDEKRPIYRAQLADAIEAAMREPVAWTLAHEFGGIFGEDVFLSRDEAESRRRYYNERVRVIPLFAFPPDAAGEILATMREKDAEIERLNNFVNGMKGIANTQAEIIAEQNAEIERLKSENALLRTGDSCARHCEGVAFRHEAQRLNKQVQDMIQAEVLLRAAPAAGEGKDG